MGGDTEEENISYVQSRLGARTQQELGRKQTPQGELDPEPRVGSTGGDGKSSGRPDLRVRTPVSSYFHFNMRMCSELNSPVYGNE